jgi:hypothetical protein
VSFDHVARLIGLLALRMALAAESKDVPSKLVLDDFESDPEGWTYAPVPRTIGTTLMMRTCRGPLPSSDLELAAAFSPNGKLLFFPPAAQ